MRQLIKITTTALFIGGSLALTTPAFAASPTDIVTTTIDQRDLKTEYGVERVYKALSRKAEASCDTAGRVTLSTKRFEDQCARQLLEDFIFDVGNESLSRYHANKSI